jgi:hypothetical protein
MCIDVNHPRVDEIDEIDETDGMRMKEVERRRRKERSPGYCGGKLAQTTEQLGNIVTSKHRNICGVIQLSCVDMFNKRPLIGRDPC